MIESRTDKTIVGKFGVRTNDIANAIIAHKSLEWISKRYPVSEAEIFEVIDYYADLEVAERDLVIKLANVGTESDIDIETTMVTDAMFFKIVQYGKIFYEHEDEFDMLYLDGLQTIISDIYTDLKKGVADFETSTVHYVIYNELRRVIGDIAPEQVLNNLPFTNYGDRDNDELN